jgi:predicted nucleic acid-binding protein
MSELELVCADASVLINILGSGVPSEILEAVGARVVVTEQVFREVKRCPFEGENVSAPLIPLREGGYLEVVELDEVSLELFVSLAGAVPPNDLDDGEASTIAYGVAHNGAVVLDERKGRRICREKFPQLRTLCSMDLFRLHFEALGRDLPRSCAALLGAIERTRMHIPQAYRAWTKEILSYRKVTDFSLTSNRKLSRKNPGDQPTDRSPGRLD